MTRLLATICIFATLFALCSADCSATASLRAMFGLSNTLTSPQTYSDIKYCKSIKTGPVCCTNTQMNSFQNYTADITANLTRMVVTRDTYINNVQTAIIPLLQSNLQAIQSYSAQITALMNSGNLGDLGNSTDLEEGFSLISNASSLLTLINSDVKAHYTNYQKARQTCFISMIKFQLAVFCLSCDPSATSHGFNSLTGEITISDKTCTRLQGVCGDYIAGSAEQNDLITASYGAQILQVIVGILKAVSAGDTAAVNNFEENLDNIQGPTSILVAPGYTPDSCRDSSDKTCTWICTDLFNGVYVDPDVLVVGGEPLYGIDENDDGGSRLLANSNRRLDSGDFEPDDDEAGVTVTFAQDPSGTNTDDDSFGNLSFGNVFFSMMIVLASLLVL